MGQDKHSEQNSYDPFPGTDAALSGGIGSADVLPGLAGGAPSVPEADGSGGVRAPLFCPGAPSEAPGGTAAGFVAGVSVPS